MKKPLTYLFLLIAVVAQLSAQATFPTANIQYDFNGDYSVDDTDLAYILLNWGEVTDEIQEPYDLFRDGWIDTIDLAYVINAFGPVYIGQSAPIKFASGRVWAMVLPRYSEFTLAWEDEFVHVPASQKVWQIQESWTPDFAVVRDSWIRRGRLSIPNDLYLTKYGEWRHTLYYRIKALHEFAVQSEGQTGHGERFSPYKWSETLRVDLPNPVDYPGNAYILANRSISPTDPALNPPTEMRISILSYRDSGNGIISAAISIDTEEGGHEGEAYIVDTSTDPKFRTQPDQYWVSNAPVFEISGTQGQTFYFRVKNAHGIPIGRNTTYANGAYMFLLDDLTEFELNPWSKVLAITIPEYISTPSPKIDDSLTDQIIEIRKHHGILARKELATIKARIAPAAMPQKRIKWIIQKHRKRAKEEIAVLKREGGQ